MKKKWSNNIKVFGYKTNRTILEQTTLAYTLLLLKYLVETSEFSVPSSVIVSFLMHACYSNSQFSDIQNPPPFLHVYIGSPQTSEKPGIQLLRPKSVQLP